MSRKVNKLTSLVGSFALAEPASKLAVWLAKLFVEPTPRVFKLLPTIFQ